MAIGTHVGQDFLDAEFIDDPQTLMRQAQTDETLLGLYPESFVLQIRQKAPPRSIFGVRNVVTALWAFPSDLAYLGHFLQVSDFTKGCPRAAGTERDFIPALPRLFKSDLQCFRSYPGSPAKWSFRRQ